MVSMASSLGKKKKMSVADIVIIVFIVTLSFTCIVPFLYMIALSLSSNEAIISQKVGLWPVGFTLETYKTILSDGEMLYTLGYSILLTVFYTVVCMFLTICGAYPLTKKRLMGRNFILSALVFTMYFSGGLIPSYILVKNLGMMNTVWSLVLPGAMSVFNLIILKTFFTNLPESLEESAAIDGCSDLGILMKIVLPLSLPSIATLSLFYAVDRWNGFQDALFYITDKNLYPMQMKLYQIISANQQLDSQQGGEGSAGSFIVPESLKAASVMFTTIPILLIYPKLQKYFVDGVMTGAIKG
ncbi:MULTISPECIES: carbohydrate ABC transporter permease [Paenibacillus]|uniref:carbohydrate ABC transporter permease n=1 Tax=Paenibacillus TaxID=44249 RepID=UPI0008BB6A72|nr:MULTISPECIES: carbohydrate ABC transporter permease [unclassified Paenibacillus]QLG39913.1 carbohydrate ABC transporter permease [Paenibacillus sp. E222]SEN92613.1 carbohydrate ABC transporter membrane protein 2, CUT1 family [Paenibacillus sp. OK076]